MLEAMPADVMVWLGDARAMFDFLDEQYWLQESRFAHPDVMRHWFTQPSISDSVRLIVLSGMSNMTRIGHPKPASVNKRQRDANGSNDEVQEVADQLAKGFYAKNKRWPTKKELVSEIKAKLPGRSGAEDKTIMREFKVTWKKTV